MHFSHLNPDSCIPLRHWFPTGGPRVDFWGSVIM